jgi:glucosyl-dolichyl phosphate glucuronosyltransferase
VASGSDHHSEARPPTVSVVICAFTFERLEEMGAAIESVRSQSVPAHEVVLVIDHDAELLAESRRRWADVRVVPNREMRGLSGARNSGVAETTGEVVAFLDDDAAAAPDWLKGLTEAYRDPRVLGAGGRVRPNWRIGRPKWFPPEFDWVVGCSHSGMPQVRAAVRNLIGASMSFRRDVLDKAGGFAQELGRMGKNSIGGDETELCIRATRARPDGLFIYDPTLLVDHVVPPPRGRLRYFAARCAAEGRSKALISRLVGSEAGLASERSYVSRTLPAGILRGLREALRGDVSGVARTATLAAGLAITTAGYVAGSLQFKLSASRRRSKRDQGEALRVLMVTPRNPLGQGGVERHVREVTPRMTSAGVEVEVLCAEPGGPAVAVERLDGVTIRSVRAWPARRDYYLAPRIWREMEREKWDLVHVQSYHTFVAPLAMLRALTLGIPYVVTFHGGGHSAPMRNRMRRLQRLALRPLLARAERLIAVARFEIDTYGAELNLPREKFILIPNGTDPPRGADLAASGDGELAMPGEQAALLATIGRLERYKGHHRVIAALPHVLERRPDARLLVVGSGPYEAALHRQASRLGIKERVEFTSVAAGDRDGMERLLRRVSLVVLLSEFETHPLAALEAAAAGRRLLVADRGGLAEFAADGLARTVPPDEPPEGVARAILEALSEPPPGVTLKLASWDECAAELLDLYGSVV